MKCASLLLCLAALSVEVAAQRLSVGVVAGASATDAFQDRTLPVVFAIPDYTSPFSGVRYFSQSKDYIVGGALEFHITPAWSIEADGFFRQLHMTSAAVLNDGSLNSVSPSPVVTWEFPVLAKYRLQRWIVEAGPSFRTAGNLNGTNPSHFGATAGLGFETHWRQIAVTPAVRYTRWAKETYRGYQAQTAPNQVELLIGLTHRSESHWRPLGDRMSLGIVLGTNLTGDYRPFGGSYGDFFTGTPVSYAVSSGPRKLIMGPQFGINLNRSFSLEVDALYRLISTAFTQTDARGTHSGTSTYVTWEFPVLAKYAFHARRFDPFIGLGPSFRRPQTISEASPYGVVAAAGLTFRKSNLRITPSIRYTHWARNRFETSGGLIRNQTQGLVGFSF